MVSLCYISSSGCIVDVIHMTSVLNSYLLTTAASASIVFFWERNRIAGCSQN